MYDFIIIIIQWHYDSYNGWKYFNFEYPFIIIISLFLLFLKMHCYYYLIFEWWWEIIKEKMNESGEELPDGQYNYGNNSYFINDLAKFLVILSLGGKLILQYEFLFNILLFFFYFYFYYFFILVLFYSFLFFIYIYIYYLLFQLFIFCLISFMQNLIVGNGCGILLHNDQYYWYNFV